MITSNATEVSKSIEKYAEQLGKKLELMVAGFAGEIAMQASLRTPIASELTIERALGIYKERQTQLGIPIAPGFHAGSWKYVEGQPVFDGPAINNTQAVENIVQGEAAAKYKLGDTFSIAAVGPNFKYIQANNDIDNATTNAVQTAFSSNIKNHFHGSSI